MIPHEHFRPITVAPLPEPERWPDANTALQEAAALLEKCAEFLGPQIDVNWEGDGPNKAMSLQTEIRAFLAGLEKRDA